MRRSKQRGQTGTQLTQKKKKKRKEEAKGKKKERGTVEREKKRAATVTTIAMAMLLPFIPMEKTHPLKSSPSVGARHSGIYISMTEECF